RGLEGAASTADREQTVAEKRAELSAIRLEIATMEAELESALAGVETLRDEIERRTLRASIDGVVAAVVDAPAGKHLQAGTRLASIVPEGPVRVVAQFQPAVSLGRIRPGQVARVRLDGFPWTQYGFIEALVRTAAGEPEDGKVRVELETSAVRGVVPLAH